MPKLRPYFIIGGVIVGIALTPVILPPALGLLGFGAAGPVAGGLAAVAQSGMGNVAAGGLFALLQSIAMGGSIPAIVYIIPGAVIGGIAGWLVGWIVDWLVDWFQKRNTRVKVVVKV
ncbi:hypothetical protein EV421DRAFT_1899384 [Armillaria borealis]|uniref:Uncharacterized protein n=1 Tax=Armillaria borealis TaxID=47425 RepID=A0AA39IUF0_9AGAR|nr:hypothetical protein EV421DRAFT_1912576 [Armillaria borealis]KAK0449897.1 hypothetical protein EV421DRAFT_1899384 [Armillaria borealis]